MTRLFLFALLVFNSGGARAHPFSLPDGFAIKKTEATARFPMFADFSEDGRLFVTESSGLDLYEELQKQTRRCRVSVLDRDLKTARVFAEELVFPMGLAWRGGKLFVADPPDLITLEDTDGDGRADKRTVILTGFGHLDNGSLHGLTFGPDGLLYMTMGQPDGYRLKRDDGSYVEGKTGALIRCKADGSGVEVLSRGFENLVEVIFLPTGEIIGTANWFFLPQDGIRDALVHLVPGGVYPLHAHAGVGTPYFFSGEMLPPVSVYPAVALSGLARYTGAMFPGAMHGSLFSAQFNTRKVVRHELARKGATFQSADEDFLSTNDPDFHPSDVLQAPDGALIVIDTGSWYVHHCPTGRIRKTTAEGGIYRITYDGPASSKKSDLQKYSPSTALDSLASDDPFVRHASIFRLHETADKARLRELLDDPRPSVRRAALIVLNQHPHNALEPVAALRAVTDSDEAVRRAGIAAFKKHVDWMPHALDVAQKALNEPALGEDARDLVRLTLSTQAIRQRIAANISDEKRSAAARRTLLELAAETKDTNTFRDAIRMALKSNAPEILEAAITATRALRLKEDLSPIAENAGLPDRVRFAAIRNGAGASDASFHFLRVRLAPTNAPAMRLAASETLNALKLSVAQSNEVKTVVASDPLLAPPTRNPADDQKLLATYEAFLTGGDENRGQQLFIGKAGCSACHRVGKHGGLVGPDLTRIGAIRSGRDLIESIALPSATFAQGYETYRATLPDGETLTGIRARRLDETFILRQASGIETKLTPGEINSVQRSPLSIMPEGILNGLSGDEIRDLFAYLQRLK